MGLDISVYANVRPMAEQPVRDATGRLPEDAWERGVRAYLASGGFRRSLRGLEDGTWYEGERVTGFRAGSYSGYNRFRADLCRAALGVEPEEVWREPEAWVDRPFYELINFADNEGTIGPEAAADLYADFRDQEGAVMASDAVAALDGDDREWFAELYATWKDAFRIAGERHGLVEFH